jgi:ring-1,2-phenylacetyl-CoA epoxidase subunit PaaD
MHAWSVEPVANAADAEISPEARAERAHLAARAWQALAEVVDPEIPMVSVVELGIVRDVRIENGEITITVTTTYSGCPASDVIVRDITVALAREGIAHARVETRLSPAWTTAWIAPEAKRKLQAYGIAPPHGAAPRLDVSGISPLRRRDAAVACPRCGSTNTQLLSQFGSTACKAQYRCDDCLEPFDYFKAH